MSSLQHLEEQKTSYTTPSAPSYAENPDLETRVTPQEFAQALAAVESRKERVERTLQETVPIEEALQQLGVTASADEILAEVRALREREAQTRQARLRAASVPRQFRRKSFVLAIGTAFLLAFCGLQLMVHTAPVGMPPIAPAQMITTTAIESPAPATELKTLEEVPEGQMVQYKTEDLKTLLQNPSISPSKVIVQTPGASSAINSWTLVKHNGHIYLRGYIASMSPQVLAQMKTLRVYTAGYDDTAAGGMAYIKPITLRIGGFVSHGINEDAGIPYITISDPHVDAYTYRDH